MDLISAIGVLATPVTLLIAVITFFASRKRDAVMDGKQYAQQNGQMLSELGYIRSSTDDIKKDIREQQTAIGQLRVDIARVDESARSAHHRLDKIEGHDAK